MERKTALVTGSAKGIGSAIAVELSMHGYDIGVNYLNDKEKAEKTAAKVRENGAKAVCIHADISSADGRRELFGRFFEVFGGIDLLVNNAGVSRFAPFLDVTEEMWDSVFATDCKAAFFCAQAAARKMAEEKKRGLIINISSNHADGCWPDASVYGSAKAALTKFGRNAAMELAKYGIRIITVEPGYTDVGWDKSGPIFDACPRIPLKRFAKPEEIAKTVCFLASDGAAYMTGSCVTVDGGALLPIVPENYLYGTDGNLYGSEGSK
ncbi:MAG TPA: 3-oxoacyl-ACP reductase [Ruminococcaceae bacterium]|nr:3-oxoacyl-ACP reductase [Oscillospiraceae bacterium]